MMRLKKAKIYIWKESNHGLQEIREQVRGSVGER
jgi:hypothetical protein